MALSVMGITLFARTVMSVSADAPKPDATGNTTAKASVKGGAITFKAPKNVDFGEVTLSNEVKFQTKTDAGDDAMNVIDYTGKQDGYYLSASVAGMTGKLVANGKEFTADGKDIIFSNPTADENGDNKTDVAFDLSYPGLKAPIAETATITWNLSKVAPSGFAE